MLIIVLVGTVLYVCGHVVLFVCYEAILCFAHHASEQQPACDSTLIPNGLTANFPATPWMTSCRRGCLGVTYLHTVYLIRLWQGLIFLWKQRSMTCILCYKLWKRKAQVCVWQNEVRVKVRLHKNWRKGFTIIWGNTEVLGGLGLFRRDTESRTSQWN